jgi:hypothetical protein
MAKAPNWRNLAFLHFVAWPGERNPPAEPSQPKDLHEERYDQLALRPPASAHSDRWQADRREQGTPAVGGANMIKRLEFPDTPEPRGISFNQPSVDYYGIDGGGSGLRQRRPPRQPTPYMRRDASLEEDLQPTPAPTWHTPTPSRQYYQPELVQSPYLQTHMVQQVAAPRSSQHARSTARKRPASSAAMHAAAVNPLSPESEVYGDLITLDPTSQRKRRRQGVYGPADIMMFPSARAYPMPLPPQFRTAAGFPEPFPRPSPYEEYVYAGMPEYVDARRVYAGAAHSRRRALEEADMMYDDMDEVDADELYDVPPARRAGKVGGGRQRVRFSQHEAAAGEAMQDDDHAASADAPTSSQKKKRVYRATPARAPPQASLDDADDDMSMEVPPAVQESPAPAPAPAARTAGTPVISQQASPGRTVFGSRPPPAQEIACQTSPTLKPAGSFADDSSASRGRPALKVSPLFHGVSLEGCLFDLFLWV